MLLDNVPKERDRYINHEPIFKMEEVLNSLYFLLFVTQLRLVHTCPIYSIHFSYSVYSKYMLKKCMCVLSHLYVL